ncbi:hypothetical protein AVEN_5848-1 [Araneus ventricosus]|uniref:Uncharacterized protein n=1 Tax=Araneus ventricosus TaxID=182803 RepID=A0A4Y2S5J5_ARAVE|nr:hypothetical protein AVEN_5848-1 [Araneus ventricosus]
MLHASFRPRRNPQCLLFGLAHKSMFPSLFVYQQVECSQWTFLFIYMKYTLPSEHHQGLNLRVSENLLTDAARLFRPVKVLNVVFGLAHKELEYLESVVYQDECSRKWTFTLHICRVYSSFREHHQL